MSARPGVTDMGGPPKPESVLNLLSLADVLNFVPPAGSLLVGDSVIELGENALLYGPPGSFKGFAVGSLMAAGAWGRGNWLGFPVNARFASLWVNCENGRRRLRDQFAKMDLPPDAADFIHITDIPDVWNLGDVRLAGEIRQTIIDQRIRLVVFDTVSNFIEDELARHFALFFAGLNTLLSGLPERPAVLLIHHSRKPKADDKGARGLLNLISGHQTLQRRSRSIIFLGRVSDELKERRVVAAVLKCSNSGETEGRKIALELGAAHTLEELSDFNWDEWEQGGATKGPKARAVTGDHIRELFGHGETWLPQAEAAEKLQEIADVGRSAAYDALKYYGHLIVKKEGKMGLADLGED